MELDGYAAAVATQQATAQQIRHAHQPHVERLRYEAPLAQRQFNRVDPDPRLVVAEVEKRWEAALAALKRAEEEQATRTGCPAPLLALSPELTTAFQAIGRHLPTWWREGRIRQQHKKALLRDRNRDPCQRWFIWTGSHQVPLEQVRTWDRKRFSQEHGYRFLKQEVLWEEAHLRTPEQVERSRWLLACACKQLLVSKQLGLALERPWESKQRAVTPHQVRRVMPSILPQVGTPARPPKPRGKSPGWQKGRPRTPAPRFAVVRKPKPVPKTPRKRASVHQPCCHTSSLPTLLTIHLRCRREYFCLHPVASKL